MVVRATLAVFLLAGAYAEPQEGPALAAVERVVDGDTVWLRLNDGPSALRRVKLRLSAIDAPERGGRAACALGAARAGEGKARPISLSAGRPGWASFAGRGAYGRLVGSLSTTDGDLGGILVAEGLARPWVKAAPPIDWCASGELVPE